MSRVFIVGPVTLGLILLLCSIASIFQILKLVRKSDVRFGWVVLTALLSVFIPGYAAFAWLQMSATVEPSNFIVAGLLFFGACFVLSVAILSRHMAKEILRIAALERNIFTDDLTGLFNRRYLSLCATSEFSRAMRYGASLALVMIDIDYFKSVNDAYGHQAGDEILRLVASTIAREIRASDIPMRYGGEELLVIATNTDLSGAIALAERIRAKVASLSMPIERKEVRISVSAGVSALRRDDNFNSLLKRADDALYCAKRSGRNRVCEEHVCQSDSLKTSQLDAAEIEIGPGRIT
jgi:diguanylate cyclase (GGDEF)-like protein